MNKKYSIKDTKNRYWGSFEAMGANGNTIYGYLKPSVEYDQIKPIFEKHEKELSNAADDNNASIDDIINLGAYLIDLETGKRINTRGIIFINADNLVACDVYDE